MNKSLKIGYGIGQISDGVKQASWIFFLFFYYNHILGLPADMVGLASLLALIVDAVTDPMIGQISDRFKSKFGRRHPLMLMGAIPFGLAMVGLFMPPEGLSQDGLFLWLLGFAVAVRLTLTFFFVPHLSLGAELEQDYHGKTSLISYRVFFTYFGILFISVAGFVVFFPPTADYANGLLNAAGYPKFGIFCAVTGTIAMLWSIIATRKVIPDLKQPTEPQNFGQSIFAFVAIFKTLKLPSFKVLFMIIMLFNTLAGISQTLLVYLGTFIYGFSSAEMGIIFLSLIIGLMLAPFIAQKLSALHDKPKALGISIIIGSLIAFSPSILYLMGVLDQMPHDSRFLYVFLANGFSQAFFIAFVILMDSMLSDIIDENELLTSKREEGFFFAARSFGSKASYGLGSFFAGIGLAIVNIPKGATPEDVPYEATINLAIFSGPILMALFLSIYFLTRMYKLNAARHGEIMTELANK